MSFFLDPWGIVVLVVSAVSLFAAGKWATRIGESSQWQLPEEPTIDFPTQQQWMFPSAPEASLPAAIAAPEAELGPIRIVNFYFSKFDAVRGPADSSVFHDEVFVELYDSQSGHRWTHSYGVATPEGLAQILEEKSWFYLYANGIIVVQKYDLNRIREAVVARIAEENELYKPAEKANEEVL